MAITVRAFRERELAAQWVGVPVAILRPLKKRASQTRCGRTRECVQILFATEIFHPILASLSVAVAGSNFLLDRLLLDCLLSLTGLVPARAWNVEVRWNEGASDCKATPQPPLKFMLTSRKRLSCARVLARASKQIFSIFSSAQTKLS